MELVGNPAMKKPIVHIAGTKGKGSTSMMLEYLLRKNGHKTGLFTSPHLISLGERIRVGEECLKPDDIQRLSSRLHDLNKKHFDGDLTFFEFLFVMAMMVFEEEGVDFVVLETGLGGRLDATNIVDPVCSVLTLIDYDHCEILGNTLGEISSEKAGIIKKGRPVIALEQEDVVHQVFVQKARVMGAPIPIHWVSNPKECPQSQNASLALEAFKVATGTASTIELKELVDLTLPGRQHECQWHGVPLLLDTAHNPVSISALLKALESKSIKYPNLLFSMGEFRNPEELLKPLLGKFEKVTFCELPSDRPGVSPYELARIWSDMGGGASKCITREGLSDVMKLQEEPLLVTGSFYLIGHLYKMMGLGPNDMVPK